MNTVNSIDKNRKTLPAFDANNHFLDISTKNKIHRHLSDINDVITEEDIRNIDTAITSKVSLTQSEQH
jgi:hypothetical protein